MYDVPLASAADLLHWMQVTNTQRTVYPFSPGLPASPFLRTTQEWPGPAEWTDDPIASWEAVFLGDPLNAELRSREGLLPGLTWPEVPAPAGAAALSLPLLLGVGVLLWLILTRS